jgi:hypothetical protein
VSIGGLVPHSHRTRVGPADAGMATAELAVALPALALLLAVCLYAVAVVTAQLRCVDAAGLAARLAGRGEAAATVQRATLLAAPQNASVEVRRNAGLVTAQVDAVVDVPILGALLPGFHVHAAATGVDDASANSSGQR